MFKWMISCSAAMLILTSTAFAIEGDYSITEGKGATGSPYTGNVVIRKLGDAYSLRWMIDKSGEQYSGVGILRDGILSVGWGAGNAVGVVSYKVTGPTLDGTWTDASGKLGIERLVRK